MKALVFYQDRIYFTSIGDRIGLMHLSKVNNIVSQFLLCKNHNDQQVFCVTVSETEPTWKGWDGSYDNLAFDAFWALKVWLINAKLTMYAEHHDEASKTFTFNLLGLIKPIFEGEQ